MVPRDFVIEAGDETFKIEAIGADGRVRTFTMRAYSGGKLFIKGFSHPVIVDLQGISIPTQEVAILRDHDSGREVGHTTSIENNRRELIVAGAISGESTDTDRILKASDRGFPWKSSIGARATRMELVRRSESVVVNGQSFRGPVIIARGSVLKEISFVANAGDDDTEVKIAASAKPLEKEESEMETFEKYVEAAGFVLDDLDDGQEKFLKAQFDDSQQDDGGEIFTKTGLVKAGTKITALQKNEPDELDFAPRRKALATEINRTNKIGEICARYHSPTIEIGEDDDKQTVSLEAHAIQENWNSDETELYALRNSRNAPKQNDGRGGGGQHNELTVKAISAALCLSVGLDSEIVAKGVSEEVMNRAMEQDLRGYTLHALMDDVNIAAGKPYRGSRKSDAFIRATHDSERDIRAAGSGFSTLSLSGVLSNLANKTMLAAYTAQATTWPQVAAVRSHSDFKIHTRYRLNATGAFTKVGPDGELKHVGLDDESFTSQLETFGAMISLTRQMQFNDDLGAFTQIPTILGRHSAIRLEEAVWVLILSNPSSHWASGNSNLITGAATALDIAALGTAEETFRKMVDSNGKPILVPPDRLVVGTTNAVIAKELFDETKVQSDTTATTRKFAANPHAGKFQPVVTPYLNNTAITDQDGKAITGQDNTQWYLFADPAVLAAVGVAFLNGAAVPVIESDDAAFNVLGVEWRAYLDFGVGMEDVNASVKSNGV